MRLSHIVRSAIAEKFDGWLMQIDRHTADAEEKKILKKHEHMSEEKVKQAAEQELGELILKRLVRKEISVLTHHDIEELLAPRFPEIVLYTD